MCEWILNKKWSYVPQLHFVCYLTLFKHMCGCVLLVPSHYGLDMCSAVKIMHMCQITKLFYLFAHQGLSIFPWTDWTGTEHPLKIWHEHPSSNHLSKYRTSNIYKSMSSFHTTLCCKLKTSFLSLPCREFYKTVKRRADAFFKANNIVIKYLANSFMT